MRAACMTAFQPVGARIPVLACGSKARRAAGWKMRREPAIHAAEIAWNCVPVVWPLAPKRALRSAGQLLCYACGMSNLDATIARLRALPKQQQEAVAAQIDLMLDEGAEDLLTPEQWAEIEARLDGPGEFTPHEDVVQSFRDR